MRKMRLITSRMPSVAKHGGYRTGLLAGEDPARFEKLHRDLVAEFSPSGALEEDIVWTMARLLWRKHHMEIVRAAQRAWACYDRIESRRRNELCKEILRSYTITNDLPPEVENELRQAVENEAREELGNDYKFIEAGKDATSAQVIKNFDVEARLDSMIDACLKRLLHVRGFKSLSSSTSSAALLPRPDGDRAA
jgi:hypothetical protein